MSIVSRKRIRSHDSNITPQSKYFVNQKMVDLHDDAKMKQIYQKTVGILFEAAKHVNNNNLEIVTNERDRYKELYLSGNGEIKFEKGKGTWMDDQVPDRDCKSCSTKSMVHTDCYNCNLELCEYCGFNCFNCRSPLCQNCIRLFNCGSFDQPCCESCTIYK